MIEDAVAVACLVWYISIIAVSLIGVYQIRQSYFHKQKPPVSTTTPRSQCPHVTIIRPVKGLEPKLYECLASTFLQTYPREKLTIFFCIASRDDPALSTLEKLTRDFDLFNARILVEEEDPWLIEHAGREDDLGPNPKIRNMSRAYREAQGDLVWIIDCNVWVSPDVAGRMVDLLCGFREESSIRGSKYKFVHQLPLVIDISQSCHDTAQLSSRMSQFQVCAGGRLEEMFLSSSHAKFYTAINTVAVAPCIVGKSNMFRRSHLNALTGNSTAALKTTASVPPSQQAQKGIDYFSSNICEDHLIGDLLWKNSVPSSVRALAASEGADPTSSTTTYEKTNDRENWSNHGLLPPHPSNLAIQPTADMPLSAYLSRRTRWLRVRKFTVTLATLVEPGTESFLCSAYGSFAITRLLLPSWSVQGRILAGVLFWAASVTAWMCVDWHVYRLLHTYASESHGDASLRSGKIDRGQRKGPTFAPQHGYERLLPPWHWVLAWFAREALALPIWTYAVLGGVRVGWRGRWFRVGMDMRVREIEPRPGSAQHKDKDKRL